MTPKTTDEIRQSYLDFFQSKGHSVVPGARLIPENDPTVLFTTAGMHPLVPYLMGEKHPSGNRLVNVQRCVRTGDIDEVGDSSHLTMFEMLGNWSLGDYFKKEAIMWSYEFLTDVLKIPREMLAVTCFEGDADAPKDMEAAGFWKDMGMPEERIGFLPKAKNWWGPAGVTGPCGPDTEMFYWVGDGPPQGNPASHDAQWLEIWNDVFMQYNRKESKDAKESKETKEQFVFEPLLQKNVDTGMGLERVAKVLQGVETVYETDRMMPIMKKVKSMRVALRQAQGDTTSVMVSPSSALRTGSDEPDTRSPFDSAQGDTTRHMRIIVDHLKAATFMIADGVKPANVDQGYVLRRIIRRAIRSARQVGIPFEGGFTPVIAEEVIAQYGHIYGHLKDNAKEIRDVLSNEEQQFLKTLQEGMKQFTKVMGSAGKTILGQDAFHLYDTYGFPLELTKEIAAEHGYGVDEAGFATAFAAHQDLSRKGAEQKFKGGLADNSGETTKLHTATHLLNAALRQVLGKHVFQKGSNITAERLRFDFSHHEKMTPEQIAEVERLVNEAIKADYPISYHVTSPDGAHEEGAIGVFGDRYGNEVKVYTMGSFSKEICGGPHVSHTGVLGSFKIQKEESSSSGVRRIKAVVSGGPEEVEVAGEK